MSKLKLTAKQEAFCRYIVAGYGQAAAYRAAYDSPRMKPANVDTEAARTRKKLNVMLRIEELQAAVTVEQVTNIGRELRRTLDMRDTAFDASNFTAVASLQRLILQAIGGLNQRVTLSLERSLSDDELIEKLAAGDPERMAAARLLLGAPEGFPESMDDETRH